MTDARFPERWLNDRRITRLSDAGFRLFVTALTWSVSNRTDGVLGDDDLALLAATDAGCADELVKAGLWEREHDLFLIADFDTTQTTSLQLAGLDHKRAMDRERKARERAHKRGDHGSCLPEHCNLSRVTSSGTGRVTHRPGQDRTGVLTEPQVADGSVTTAATEARRGNPGYAPPGWWERT